MGSSQGCCAMDEEAFASAQWLQMKFCLTIGISRTNVRQMEERELRVGAAGDPAGLSLPAARRSWLPAGYSTDQGVEGPAREPMEVAP
jgi:hypothetical protein